MANQLLELFMKKNCKKKKKKKEKKKEKKNKIKMINWMSNRENMIIHLVVGLIKKTLYKNESILSYTV